MVTFLITQLDSPVALVFGYTWFYRYNPLIDWYKGQILSFQTPSQVRNQPRLVRGSQSCGQMTPSLFSLSQLQPFRRSPSRGTPILCPRGLSHSRPVLIHQKF